MRLDALACAWAEMGTVVLGVKESNMAVRGELMAFAAVACVALVGGIAFAGEGPTHLRPTRSVKFIPGVCTHLGGDRFTPATLEMLKQSGAMSVRDEIGWIGVERKQGEMSVPPTHDRYFNSTLAAGLDPLLILNYGNPFYDKGDSPRTDEGRAAFVRYAEFMVNHFKDRLYLYEFWNEWDIAIGGTTPGTADNYAALLKLVYPAIKKIDPDILLMAGATTPMAIKNGWLERMLELGALEFCDAVSIHTYVYGSKGQAGSPEAWAAWMQQVQEIIHKYSGGKDVPLYVTEHGWPTQIDERGRTPAVSGEYLARLYLLARTMPWMKGIWWYDFEDDAMKYDYNEANFGIIRPDLTPKPSWYALRDVADLAANAEYLGREDAGDPDVWVLKFRRPDGRDTWAVWSAHEDDDWQVRIQTDPAKRFELTIREVGREPFRRSWGDKAWYDDKRTWNENQVSLIVRGNPWLIEGDLSAGKCAGVAKREFPEAKRMIDAAR